MRQLKYNDNFNNIVEDIELLTDDTIPSFIHDFILSKSNNRLIYEENSDKYYCPKCFHELDKKYYCHNCQKKYKWFLFNIFSIGDIDEETSDDRDFYYYYFDTKSFEPILYQIKENVYLYRTTHRIYVRKVMIENAFLIKKDCIIDLINKKKYDYKKCTDEINETARKLVDDMVNNIDDIDMSIYDLFFAESGFLYIDNLNKLMNTVYKYTRYWDNKKYLNNNRISLYELTIIPLFNPNFEYLVKYGLHKLAFEADAITFKNSFKRTFKLDKRYLDFMVKYDINKDELLILQLTKKEDIRFIRKLASYYYYIDRIYNDYHVDINKLVDYFKEKNYSYHYLSIYRDYLKLCNEFGFNMKDKRTLFPNNFIKVHNKLSKEYEITKNSEIDNKIKKISKVLEINKYEDDNYIIYPASNLSSMIDEASNQNNCLRSYCNDYANGKTNIYFMRLKSNPNKSLVTIEVVNNKVIQARIKNNKSPSNNMTKVINNWEKALTPIDFSK